MSKAIEHSLTQAPLFPLPERNRPEFAQPNTQRPEDQLQPELPFSPEEVLPLLALIKTTK